MSGSERLNKLVPIRFMAMSWIPVFIIYLLPNLWWAFIIKGILLTLILVIFISAFSPIWSSYQTLGAFVVLNTFWFAGLLWISNPGWMAYIFILLIMTSFGTIFLHIDKKNKQGNISK